MGVFLGFGCAGEIRISEHEEYEKWAIDILVKFRDTEKLQLLTAQRQSGGVCRYAIPGFSGYPPPSRSDLFFIFRNGP